MSLFTSHTILLCLVTFSDSWVVHYVQYGSRYSFRVHATPFNPWVWVFFGTVVLTISFALDSSLSIYAFDGGFLVLLFGIIRLKKEISRDLERVSRLLACFDVYFASLFVSK